MAEGRRNRSLLWGVAIVVLLIVNIALVRFLMAPSDGVPLAGSGEGEIPAVAPGPSRPPDPVGPGPTSAEGSIVRVELAVDVGRPGHGAFAATGRPMAGADALLEVTIDGRYCGLSGLMLGPDEGGIARLELEASETYGERSYARAVVRVPSHRFFLELVLERCDGSKHTVREGAFHPVGFVAGFATTEIRRDPRAGVPVRLRVGKAPVVLEAWLVDADTGREGPPVRRRIDGELVIELPLPPDVDLGGQAVALVLVVRSSDDPDQEVRTKRRVLVEWKGIEE